MSYRLLDVFKATFDGRQYRHRDSSRGDLVAMHLYEDLLAVGKSEILCRRIRGRERVVNRQNRPTGIWARRGDGTFGELVPNATAVDEDGFLVARGPVATIEIGVEVKILAKAMIKQIDRVINDLRNQVEQFRRGGGDAVSVGIVGVNYAAQCTSYEGGREWRTDGGRYKHPFQEAPKAERRLRDEAVEAFDEFLLLRYRATNAPPFAFDWVGFEKTELDYGAILTRVSRKYDRAFGGADPTARP